MLYKTEGHSVVRVKEWSNTFEEKPSRISQAPRIELINPNELKGIKGDEIKSGGLYVLGGLQSNLKDHVFKAEKEVEWGGRKSVVFQVISGLEGNNIMFLGENECKEFGIDYKEKLVLLPANMSWTRLEDPEYKPYLSGKSVEFIVIKIPGFKGEDDIIETPCNTVTDLTLFMLSLKVVVAKDIIGIGEYGGLRAGYEIPFSLVNTNYGKTKFQSKNHISDQDGCITLILDLRKDGLGISSASFKGRTPESLFEVTWDDAFSIKTENGEPVEKSSKTGRLVKYVNAPRDIFIKKSDGKFWRNTNKYGYTRW